MKPPLADKNSVLNPINKDHLIWIKKDVNILGFSSIGVGVCE